MLREMPFTDVFTILIAVSLLLVTSAKVGYSKRFLGLTNILTDFKYLNSFTRDYKFLNIFEFLLFCNFLIEASIFGTLLFKVFSGTSIFSETIIFQITGAVFLFLTTKFIIEKLVSYILNIKFLIGNYLFQKLSYLNFTGLLLIPINALFLFNITANITIYAVITILLLLFNSYVILIFIKNNLNLIKENLFYFILYLCTLEIGPYVVLYKLFTRK